mgnify:CR=1 FL=1
MIDTSSWLDKGAHKFMKERQTSWFGGSSLEKWQMINTRRRSTITTTTMTSLPPVVSSLPPVVAVSENEFTERQREHACYTDSTHVPYVQKTKERNAPDTNRDTNMHNLIYIYYKSKIQLRLRARLREVRLQH